MRIGVVAPRNSDRSGCPHCEVAGRQCACTVDPVEHEGLVCSGIYCRIVDRSLNRYGERLLTITVMTQCDAAGRDRACVLLIPCVSSINSRAINGYDKMTHRIPTCITATVT